MLPGLTVEPRERQALIGRVLALRPAPHYLVLSGSLPPGAPADLYARFVHAINAQVTRVVVNSSGPALAATLDTPVYMVKASVGELRELTGRELLSDWALRDAAMHILSAKRAELLVLSLGAEGALVVTHERCIRLPGTGGRRSDV